MNSLWDDMQSKVAEQNSRVGQQDRAGKVEQGSRADTPVQWNSLKTVKQNLLYISFCRLVLLKWINLI